MYIARRRCVLSATAHVLQQNKNPLLHHHNKGLQKDKTVAYNGKSKSNTKRSGFGKGFRGNKSLRIALL